jgi:hypothetical protein
MNFQEPISDQQIERSLWLIKNQALIKKVTVIILLIIIFSFFSFSLIKFINIKIQDQKKLEFNSVTIDFISLQKQNRVQNPIIINQHIISLGNNKYDLIIEMKNPNNQTAITELKYKFTHNNQSGEEKTAFFLPNETKKLIDFNIESNKIIRKIDLEIINIDWQRLKISEIEEYQKNIFVISNEIKHFDNQKDKARNWVEFTASNQSPYNWLQTRFYVSLYLGSKLIAINEIITDKFYSQEEKNLKASWFQKMPSYLNLKIEAKTNLLDPKNYISHQ